MAKTVAERRNTLHMSQQDISSKMGVGISTWRRWEAGNDQSPMLDMCLQFLESRLQAIPLSAQSGMQRATDPGRPATTPLGQYKQAEVSGNTLVTFAHEDGHIMDKLERMQHQGELAWSHSLTRGWATSRLAYDTGFPAIPQPDDPAQHFWLPIPAWLAPELEACPATRAYYAGKAYPNVLPEHLRGLLPRKVLPPPIGQVPAEIRQEMAEVDEILRARGFNV